MTNDRLDRMMADPEAYFAQCRERARQMVERDLERERERRRAARVESRRRWFRWFR